MRVLVTGAAGQVGQDLVDTCTSAGDDVVAASRADLDVTSRDAVLGCLGALRPEVVFHTAAWTAVDHCESDPERAFVQNAMAVRWVAEGCDRFGAHLVHVSTDYVFDGTKTSPYCEWDEPGPRSVYGTSKLAGEREALALGTRAAIVRTSWVCGEHGANMVKTVLRLLDAGSALRFVDDQRGCPTFTASLAPVLRRIALERLGGIYHATNTGAVTWFDFVRDIVRAAGADPELVRPVSTADLTPPRPAPRPANSVLDAVALRAAGFPPVEHYSVPLRDLVARLTH